MSLEIKCNIDPKNHNMKLCIERGSFNYYFIIFFCLYDYFKNINMKSSTDIGVDTSATIPAFVEASTVCCLTTKATGTAASSESSSSS